MNWIVIALVVSGGGGKISRPADGRIYLEQYKTETECVTAAYKAENGWPGSAICIQVSGIGRPITESEIADIEAKQKARALEIENKLREAKEKCDAADRNWNAFGFCED